MKTNVANKNPSSWSSKRPITKQVNRLLWSIYSLPNSRSMNVPSVDALTTTNLASIFTASKTNVETMIYTLQSSANLLKQRNAQSMIDVNELTTESSVFTIKISIRPSFVTVFRTRLVSANTATTAPSLTQLKTWKCVSCTTWCPALKPATLTSSCFSSKLSGVRSITSTIKLSVFTHTTFRISEDGLTSLGTQSTSARIGRAAPSLLATMKVVRDLNHVFTVMAGKSSNFTLLCIKHCLARR